MRFTADLFKLVEKRKVLWVDLLCRQPCGSKQMHLGTDLSGNFINARGVIIGNVLRSTHQNLRVPRSVCLRDKRNALFQHNSGRALWCVAAAAARCWVNNLAEGPNWHTLPISRVSWLTNTLQRTRVLLFIWPKFAAWGRKERKISVGRTHAEMGAWPLADSVSPIWTAANTQRKQTREQGCDSNQQIQHLAHLHTKLSCWINQR